MSELGAGLGGGLQIRLSQGGGTHGLQPTPLTFVAPPLYPQPTHLATPLATPLVSVGLHQAPGVHPPGHAAHYAQSSLSLLPVSAPHLTHAARGHDVGGQEGTENTDLDNDF